MYKYSAVALLLLFAACKKDGGKPYMPLNSDLRKNYSFKEGSYWIYRDSLSGREDSFFVTKYSHSDVEGQNVDYEAAGMAMSQRNVGGFFSDIAFWNIAMVWGNTISLSNDQWPSGRHFYASELGKYPFVNSDYVVSFPSVTLAGSSYDDVTSVIWNDYSTIPKNIGNFYFKDSIGFVKIDLQIDTLHRVWELERYHINY